MRWYEIFYFTALIVTHAVAYYWGKSDVKKSSFKPTNEAWVAVQCHAIDKQYEYARWANEHGRTAESSDQ